MSKTNGRPGWGSLGIADRKPRVRAYAGRPWATSFNAFGVKHTDVWMNLPRVGKIGLEKCVPPTNGCGK